MLKCIVCATLQHLSFNLKKLWWGEMSPDMPPGTDCPYPIRIWAFFEMIRPYHAVIRIWGKLLKNNLWICVAKPNSFIVTQLAFSAKFPKKTGDFASVKHDWPSIRVVGLIWLSRKVKLIFWFFAAGCRFLLHNVAIFLANCIAIWIAWTFSRYIDA